MTSDIENELRDLFREKAGEAPLATPGAPATAPPRVLRRGRRRQLGTVLGSVAAVVVVIAGSVAGLQRLLADGPEPLPPAGYDVFERTATVEAFTVTSPSDWFLVNEWPLSLTVAVEGTSGSSSFECQGTPVGEDIEEIPECSEAPDEATTELIPVPHGLPMIQLTNVDMGLGANACADGIPASGAALYVAYDAEQAISGIADPSIPPFPPGDPGLPPEGDGPCGPGRYAHFTVNREPFFAWVGLGPGVSDEDREIVETAYERMSAIPDWTPQPPTHLTPGYVIAGGDGWRLELRPAEGAIELSLQNGAGSAVLHTDGSVDPLTWTGSDPIFGTISKSADGVGFQPDDGGGSITGTIVPVPPSLHAFGFDTFFMEGTEGLTGDVVAVGLGPGTEASTSPTPEPAADVVSLSGGDETHTWIVRFTGSFVDDSACIRVRVDTEALDSPCSIALASSLAYDGLSLQSWLTDSMYLLAGAKPVGDDIRFVRPDGAGISELRCTTGPVGWPDRDVCVAVLPPEAASRTIQYLDSDGNVLHEVRATPWMEPVEPVHGGTYWAVYPWLGTPGDPEADEVTARLAADFGIEEAFPGDLSCDEGASEALGTDAEQGIGVYFETEEDANAFAVDAGLLGHEADPVIAQVTTYCLD